jgi:hypothetical protein
MIPLLEDEGLPEEDLSSLDDLFAEARRAKRKAAAAAPAPAPIDPRARYNEPQNWRETRRVALVHQGTQAYLGTYTELVHKFIPGCRRLVRCQHLCPVSETEMISGDSWLEYGAREITL